MIRSVAKHALETVLVRTGAARLLDWRRDRRALILLYHNVVPDGHVTRGESALHLPLSEFIKQIEWASREFQVVPLEQVFTDPANRPPRLVLTFDDAYRGAVHLGIPELIRRGLPSTLFVAPGLLGRKSTWWDRYSRVLSSKVGDRSFRDLALSECHGDEDKIDSLAAELNLGPQSAVDIEGIVDLEELRAKATSHLLTLGLHSWGHPNLEAAPAEVLTRELVHPQEWFLAQGIPFKPWLAYPYGRASDQVVELSVAHGYNLGFMASGGWIRGHRGTDPLKVPRLSVGSGLSLNGFKLRLSGLLRSD
jgi:peptidoglycan/xylan/chitin deacetylase (PgdA/CDA1 family)